MRPRDLLQQFVKFTPEFQAQWNSDHNLSLDDDGTFTLHGVASEFSYFFKDNYARLSDADFKELFEFIESNLVEPGVEETLLDNALCTCFLENIASEPCGEAAKPWMGRKSRGYFDNWHAGPPY